MSIKITMIATSLCVLIFTHQSVWAESRTPPEAIELNNRAVNCLNKGNLERSVELLRKAIQIDPQYMLARGNLAIAYHQDYLKHSGEADLETALICLEKANFWYPYNQSIFLDTNHCIKKLGFNPESIPDRLTLANKALLRNDLEAFLGEITETIRMAKLELSPAAQSKFEYYDTYAEELTERLKKNWAPSKDLDPFNHTVQVRINCDGEIRISTITAKYGSEIDKQVRKTIKNFGVPKPLYKRDKCKLFRFSFTHGEQYDDVIFNEMIDNAF